MRIKTPKSRKKRGFKTQNTKKTKRHLSNNTSFQFDTNLKTLLVKSCSKKKCQTIKIDTPQLMTNKKLITQMYENNIRRTIYDNVSAVLDNNKYPNIFGSNIDTILICNALKRNHYLFKNINNFLELGIGGGFISKYISSKFKLKEAVLIDIEPDCIEYAIKDLNLPALKRQKKQTYFQHTPFRCKIVKKNGYIFMQGDGIKIMNHFFCNDDSNITDDLDLLVCNPPYIPNSSNEYDMDTNAPNFWEGTRLLRYLILNFSKISSKCVCIVSSLSLLNKYVISALQKIKFKVLKSHPVPIKVFNKNKDILDDPNMLRFLTSKNETVRINNVHFHVGAIKGDTNDLYPYYHDVNVLYFYM